MPVNQLSLHGRYHSWYFNKGTVADVNVGVDPGWVFFDVNPVSGISSCRGVNLVKTG